MKKKNKNLFKSINVAVVYLNTGGVKAENVGEFVEKYKNDHLSNLYNIVGNNNVVILPVKDSATHIETLCLPV